MAVPDKLFSIPTILQRGVDIYPELSRRWTALVRYLQQYAADHTHSGGPDGGLIVGGQAGHSDNRTFTNTSFLDLDALTGGSGSIAAVSFSITTAEAGRALIMLGCQFGNDTLGAIGTLGVNVTGATTQTANDALSFRYESSAANDICMASYVWPLTLGSGTTTFELQAKTSAGTQTIDNPRIVVIPFT